MGVKPRERELETKPVRRYGVLLAGSGWIDGSDPLQALAFLTVAWANGDSAFTVASDDPQHDTINALTGDPLPPRSMRAEAARLTGGDCRRLEDTSAVDLDGLFVPGGLGTVKSLCAAAVEGNEAPVHPAVATLINGLFAAGKPLAAADEGVVLLASALRHQQLTLAGHSRTLLEQSISQLGHRCPEHPVDAPLVDDQAAVVTMAIATDAHPAQVHDAVRNMYLKMAALSTD